MLVSALRQRILELAIQGKLVPQLPKDGTAEELYQQIQLEKKKLIAAGKLKKGKALPPITEEEIPFDIPKSWKWVRLGDVFEIITGKTPSKSNNDNYTPASVPFYKPADIGLVPHIETASQQVSEKGSKVAHLLPKGSILVNCIGSIGKCSIIDKEGICNQQINAVISIASIDMDYILSVMRSDYAVKAERHSASATTISILNKQKFSNICIPLPPLAEQKRIAEKIETLFAELDTIERSQERVAAIQAELNKRILERAVQGKLVSQCPEEGTAEELYQQIQQEKKKLIAAGKLKKEKPLPPITEDEIPFDIPDSWKWVRLGALSSLITKGTTPRGGNLSYSSSGIAFLRAENVVGITQLDKSNLRYVDQETHSTVLKRSILEEDDILITIAGTLGRTALVRKEDLPLNANQAVSFMRPIIHDMHTLKYILYALNASVIKNILLKQQKVTAIPNLTLENISSCCIPFPPISEQRRIVKKLEQMLPQLGKHQSQQHHDDMHLQEHKYTE